MRPIFLIALVLCLSQSACGGVDGCQNEIVQELASPDGRLKATLFQRDCGATTGLSSQVSVLQPDETISGSGNVFVADSDHEHARLGAWGGPAVVIEWMSSQNLHITYASGLRVFKQEERIQGVTLTYQIGDDR